jgi:hypothetical protein
MRNIYTFLILIIPGIFQIQGQIIVDHTSTDISLIPQAAIQQAKEDLHIAYGHTSHGSQLTEGMKSLVEFANAGGLGISLPTDFLSWNDGGSDGALDLHDKAMEGDAGIWPDWYDNTIAYLEDEANSDVNVVMWSWCGQVGRKYSEEKLWDEYLGPMSDLENEYPDISFVYMTGHLDYAEREITNAANDSIRSFCRNNNKVLYDFADIESWGHDGTHYKENGDDDCDYFGSQGDSIGNWALEYQDTHEEGTDWFDCVSAHSEAYNANLKAYATWWLFAELGGWDSGSAVLNVEANDRKPGIQGKVVPNPVQDIAYLDLECADIHPQITLLSSSGRILQHRSEITSEGYRIDMGAISPGVYYLVVKTEEAVRSFRVIKEE